MPVRPRAALLIAALLAAGPAAPAAAAQPAPRAVVMRLGPAYPDAALTGYVAGVGRRLAAAAGAGGSWRFVVLDTPDANAYALPDRRVLVTRGMLALAGDEAELAAVLAHEIAHVLAGDAAARGPRPGAEEAADRRGLGLLAAAGYDPRAQAALQGKLVAAHGLDARLRGLAAPFPARAYDPGLARRLDTSRAAAARAAGGRRGRESYLAAIDGMAWGPRSAGLRLRVHRIAPGDDVLALATTMPVGNAPRARFDLLNGLAPGASLRVGDLVKLVSR